VNVGLFCAACTEAARTPTISIGCAAALARRPRAKMLGPNVGA
jgi:hypothetical protein